MEVKGANGWSAGAPLTPRAMVAVGKGLIMQVNAIRSTR